MDRDLERQRRMLQKQKGMAALAAHLWKKWVALESNVKELNTKFKCSGPLVPRYDLLIQFSGELEKLKQLGGGILTMMGTDEGVGNPELAMLEHKGPLQTGMNRDGLHKMIKWATNKISEIRGDPEWAELDKVSRKLTSKTAEIAKMELMEGKLRKLDTSIQPPGPARRTRSRFVRREKGIEEVKDDLYLLRKAKKGLKDKLNALRGLKPALGPVAYELPHTPAPHYCHDVTTPAEEKMRRRLALDGHEVTLIGAGIAIAGFVAFKFFRWWNAKPEVTPES